MIRIFKKNIFLFAASILFVLIFFTFFSRLSFYETNILADSKVQLKANKSIAQKFISPRDNLTKIELLLGGESGLKKPTEVEIKLADENCTQTLQVGSIKSFSLDRNNAYEFNFPTIKNSENKTYCLILTYRSEKKNSDIRINLLDQSSPASKIFPENILIDNQKSDAYFLAIRTAHTKSSWQENIDKLNKRISQYKPWFFKHYFLYAIFLGFIVLSVCLVVILIRLTEE